MFFRRLPREMTLRSLNFAKRYCEEVNSNSIVLIRIPIMNLELTKRAEIDLAKL